MRVNICVTLHFILESTRIHSRESSYSHLGVRRQREPLQLRGVSVLENGVIGHVTPLRVFSTLFVARVHI